MNDYARHRLFLGPYQGRDPALPTAVAGIFSNPMNEARANKIPLGTIARYLNDPQNYEYEEAWRQSILDLGGGDEELLDALFAFAENSQFNVYPHSVWAPMFAEYHDQFLKTYDMSPFWPTARDAFVRELVRERRAPARISERRPDLAAEITGWLEQFHDNDTAAMEAVELLAAQRPALDARATLEESGVVAVEGRATPPSPSSVTRRFDEFESACGETVFESEENPFVVHGGRNIQSTSAATVQIDSLDTGDGNNRIDEFSRQTNRRTQEWLPHAARAASDVTITVQGEPVPVDESGSFSTTLSRPVSEPIEVVAADGADG